LETEEEPESLENPSISEVFGQIVSSEEQIFRGDETKTDKDTHTQSPSVEEIFGSDVDEDKIASIYEQLEDKDKNENVPSLEEIFANEFNQEEINLLAKASQLDLEDDKNSTQTSLDSVFEPPDFQDVEAQEILDKVTQGGLESDDQESFIDPKITFTTIEEAAREEFDRTEHTPDLEDVFGENVTEEEVEANTTELKSQPTQDTSPTSKPMDHPLVTSEKQQTEPLSPKTTTGDDLSTSKSEEDIETETIESETKPSIKSHANKSDISKQTLLSNRSKSTLTVKLVLLVLA